jgi:nucleoside-diphosphate-sugar epimerase
MVRGHPVTGLDTGFYREGWLYHPQNPKSPACINKDLRRINEEDLAGFDAVVHLAELSNDPLGQHNPQLTSQINHQGTVTLAQKCVKAGITRFVYTSSCNVYGPAQPSLRPKNPRPILRPPMQNVRFSWSET